MLDHDAAVRTAYAWWSDLQDEKGSSRARAARLRRCASVPDALLMAETHELLRALKNVGFDILNAGPRVAVLAMTLACIRSGDTRSSFASALGQIKNERPMLSPARFGAMMRAAHDRDFECLARAIRRASSILSDTSFNVRTFASDILFLNDETLRRWTYGYWQTDAPQKLIDDQASSQTEMP